MNSAAFDERIMRYALQLARRGHGPTSPNPMVGAVLIKNGRIIGKGYHRKAGEPHAEVLAIRDAVRRGKAARGATLYVTLEPCSTFGRTPPCIEAILVTGIKRVVVAAIDPNPKHAGRGIKILGRAGVRVETGLLAEEATRLNEAFNKWIVTSMPFVIAKAAMSLDGKIATCTGDSKWITPPSVRALAHRLRAEVDAVVVGAGTVIADNPSLTVRHGVRTKRQSCRVVLDSRGCCPLDAAVFTDRFRARTIVFTSRLSPPRWRTALEKRGVTVLTAKLKGKHLDLRAALKTLGERGVTSVLIEGGGALLGSAFDERLVDKVNFFYAPIVIGGRDAVAAVAGTGVKRIPDSIRFENGRWRRLAGGVLQFEACAD